MGLSNNKALPSPVKVQKKQNFHGEGDDQPLDVWHWSLQFSRDKKTVWVTKPHFLCDILHLSDAENGFRTVWVCQYLRHIWFILIPGFKSIGKKNIWFKSLPFAGSFAQCFQWLYGCIGTPTGLWSVAAKPPILLVKFTCVLTWLTSVKKNRSSLLISSWLRKKLVPGVPELDWWCLWCFFCWLKPSIFCSLALPEGWCYEKGPGDACQKLHNHH